MEKIKNKNKAKLKYLQNMPKMKIALKIQIYSKIPYKIYKITNTTYNRKNTTKNKNNLK